MAEMSSESKQFKQARGSYKNILVFLVVVMVLQIVFLLIACFVPSCRSIIVPLVAVILLCLMTIFIRWIYLPLLKIEQSLQAFETYGDDFSLNIDRYSDIYPIAHSLNRIHSHMQEFIDREYMAHIKQKDAEIHALQSQINPHFLYNTLDVIRSLALINNDNDVANMAEALSTFFRYSISKKGHIVALREELENINNYLSIQNCRFKDKISFQVIFDDDNETVLDCQLPKLLLQPIIENAVYHGIEPKVGKGQIVMRIFTTDAALVVNVKDDGVGMSEENLLAIRQKLQQGKYAENSLPYESGIALININQRILLNYGDSYGILISSTEGLGSEVELRIPIIYPDSTKKL